MTGSTTIDNRTLYERFCREALALGNLDVIDELVAEDVVSHSPFPNQAPGRRGFKDALAQFRAAFPELRIEIRDIIAEGQKVVGYFNVTAVHQGDFMGISATGKTISYEEMVIVRFDNGKIVEHWSVSDSLAMMQALGAVSMNTSPSSPSEVVADARVSSSDPLPVGLRQRVEAFFARYADRFNRSLAGEEIDAKDVADSFAEHFVEASPEGVNHGKNGLLFRWMIPRGFEHYRKIGTTKMNVADLDIETIDPLHALAKVHWDSFYTKNDGSHEHIEFDVTYLLHFEAGAPKIFAYITGDEAKALREHGLS